MGAAQELLHRAENIAQLGRTELDRESRQQVLIEYRAPLNSSVLMNIRTSAIVGGTERHFNRGRWIFLTDTEAPETPEEERRSIFDCGHGPFFSINIDTLDDENYKEPSGLLERWTELEPLCEDTKFGSAEDTGLIRTIFAAVKSIKTGALLGEDILDEIPSSFATVLSKGSTVVQRSTHGEIFDGGSTIDLREVNITGSLQHLTFHTKLPKLLISLHQIDEQDHAVFSQRPTGSYETYLEIADPLEREARVEGSKVIRDSEENIILVTSNPEGKEALEDAERAVGLRDLRLDYLDLFKLGLEDFKKTRDGAK